ncbi:MAG: hypothetical protein ACI841_001853 [Planctomycetota bacterium]|jgi:hypothetical protein
MDNDMSGSDYFMAAADLFERERGAVMDDFQQRSLEQQGLVDANPVHLVQNIRAMIMAGDLTAEARYTAYFALGKTWDLKLVPFFQQCLKQEVAQGTTAVYQLLICLSDFGQEVFGGDRDGSFSAMDEELNMRDALAYLDRIDATS